MSPCCLSWLIQAADFAVCFVAPNAGRSIPARIAMIAMTTRSSIKVNLFPIMLFSFQRLCVCRSCRVRHSTDVFMFIVRAKADVLRLFQVFVRWKYIVEKHTKNPYFETNIAYFSKLSMCYRIFF